MVFSAKLRIISSIFLCIILGCSFVSKEPINGKGTFSFVLNNKPYVIEGFTAKYRTVTGGYKQLSLSNDFFTSFFFNNPTAKSFELSSKSSREAIVKYTNPSNLHVYTPEKGRVTITSFDTQTKLISGDFEIEMIDKTQPNKKIIITQGKFTNVPLTDK
jgi:hypothetical protein